LAKAMDGPYTTHHDEFTNLEAVPIVPRVRSNPQPSVWATVMSPSSATWCAERGWKICTAWMPQPVVNILAHAYRDAAEAAGQSPSAEMLGLRRRVFVASSDAQAEEITEEALDIMRAFAGAAFETTDPKIFEMLKDPDDFVIGSPETVADKLIDQCRQGGYGHLVAWTDFKAFKWDDLLRSHELLGTKVAPLLRSASVERVGEPTGG
jgi:alkanesulfonate monooxygenase SsuD/methylene tetrahydromethanopterin reductase-like flavin-dependent oxidoreductase (luciferase family)